MKKKFIITIFILIVFGGVGIYGAKVYKQWNNRAHYYARLNYDAHTILKEIQNLQKKYYEKHGQYAVSIKELIKDSQMASRHLKENPNQYPGLAKNGYSGSAYFYSIEEVSKNDFTAQAKYKGFQENGEDIWQILKDGSPYPIVTQKYYRRK